MGASERMVRWREERLAWGRVGRTGGETQGENARLPLAASLDHPDSCACRFPRRIGFRRSVCGCTVELGARRSEWRAVAGAWSGGSAAPSIAANVPRPTFVATPSLVLLLVHVQCEGDALISRLGWLMRIARLAVRGGGGRARRGIVVVQTARAGGRLALAGELGLEGWRARD